MAVEKYDRPQPASASSAKKNDGARALSKEKTDRDRYRGKRRIAIAGKETTNRAIVKVTTECDRRRKKRSVAVVAKKDRPRASSKKTNDIAASPKKIDGSRWLPKKRHIATAVKKNYRLRPSSKHKTIDCSRIRGKPTDRDRYRKKRRIAIGFTETTDRAVVREATDRDRRRKKRATAIAVRN